MVYETQLHQGELLWPAAAACDQRGADPGWGPPQTARLWRWHHDDLKNRCDDDDHDYGDGDDYDDEDGHADTDVDVDDDGGGGGGVLVG